MQTLVRRPQACLPRLQSLATSSSSSPSSFSSRYFLPLSFTFLASSSLTVTPTGTATNPTTVPFACLFTWPTETGTQSEAIRSFNMAYRSYGSSNAELIERMSQYGLIESEQVKKAMLETDRGKYCVRTREGNIPAIAYQDSPQPIGYYATISAPHMHAMCLELLKDHLKPGSHALDVGSGSGYLVACMARMTGASGKIYGIEHIPELVEFSINNVKSDDEKLLKDGVITIKQGDGRDGFSEGAPYDCIHVGAAADKIPPALLEQLKVGGLLVIPVGVHSQELELIEKTSATECKRRKITEVRYVPLTSQQHQLNPNE